VVSGGAVFENAEEVSLERDGGDVVCVEGESGGGGSEGAEDGNGESV